MYLKYIGAVGRAVGTYLYDRNLGRECSIAIYVAPIEVPKINFSNA